MEIRRHCQLPSLGPQDYVNMLVPDQGHSLAQGHHHAGSRHLHHAEPSLKGGNMPFRKVLVACIRRTNLSPGCWQSWPLSPASLASNATQHSPNFEQSQPPFYKVYFLNPRAISCSGCCFLFTGRKPEAWRDEATC